MGLIEYKRKRKFNETPEPEGGEANGDKLQFVIQKHDASRLHYDFRLELKGVLKSWAVPKGPSLNPADKRLAMLVEDHPFDYKSFEGIIPAGNYGAGTVIIWDQGWYEPVDELGSKAKQEKFLSAALHKGSVKIRMHGEKLKGEFALVQTKSRGENSWLLIKHRDDFASTDDIGEQDQSVVSGKTLEEVTADPNSGTWSSNRSAQTAEESPVVKKAAAKKKTAVKEKAAAKKKAPVKKSTSKKKSNGTVTCISKTDVKSILSGIKTKIKSAIPGDVKPMLATLVDEPSDEQGWLYEVKWDGYRALSYLQNEEVTIRSRNNKDFNKKFYPVVEALRTWNINAVVDGEIVVVNDKGEPDFNALQEWRSEADGQLIYYLFDILWLDGYDLMQVPLSERKDLLKHLTPGNGIIRLSENFDITGKAFFAEAEKLGLEGIMAKKSDSVYKPDQRGKEWVKIKTQKHQEAIIAGYTRNENTKKLFSALLLGVYENDELRFIGPVGTGFTMAVQKEILGKMEPHKSPKCPFAVVPDYNKPSRFRPDPPKAEVQWLKPNVVAEIAYRSLSGDGSLRHPSFRGLRDDKNAKEVAFEKPIPVSKVTDTAHASGKKSIIEAPGKSERKTLLNPGDETQVRKINGHDLKFTNLSKIFWPDEGLTKRDMLNYYYQVAPVMLPYLKDRPQTLNRFPNGINGKSFYQKDVTGKVPSWIETYLYYSEGDQREKHFLVCTDEASLLYIAALGCIEINPWSSRRDAPDNPDWCIIDLDPDKKNTFEQVIEAARVTKEILDAIEVPSYVKTSGSTGLHIYIPLEAKYTYEESKEFARAIVKIITSQIPAYTSIERKVTDRKGKMYLDFLQNRPQATVAGPYSLRPKPGGPVSMPLHWEEVKKGLSILDFTLANAVARIRSEGDLFAGVLGKGIDMSKAMNLLIKTFSRH